MLRLDQEMLLAVLGTEESLALDDDSVGKYEIRRIAVLSDRFLVVDGEAFIVGGKAPARDLLGQGFL